MNDACRDFAPIFEADEHSPERIAAHEIAGAVNGIDDPAPAVARFLARALFAEQAVFGKILFESRRDETLAFTIGNGDRRIVRFRFRYDSARLVLQGKLGRLKRDPASNL